MSQALAVEAVASREAGAAPSRGTVYVIQGEDNGKYQRAQRYGELVFLLKRDAYPDNAEERIETMRHIMRALLKPFDPTQDYILLTGDPLAIAMTILVLSAWYAHTEIPCLKWDKHEQDYYPVVVSV